MERVLLIDLDNCPNQFEALSRQMDEFTRIIACYGGAEPKIPLRLVPALAAPVMDGRLEILGMEKKGKNAADFGLAFMAGRLMGEMPPETEFLILSQDTDLDHVINLLKQFKRRAVRWNGSLKSDTDSSAQKEGQHPESCLKEIAEEYLYNYSADQQRPRKRKTLVRSIRAFLKNDRNVKPESVYEHLVSSGYVIFWMAAKFGIRGKWIRKKEWTSRFKTRSQSVS